MLIRLVTLLATVACIPLRVLLASDTINFTDINFGFNNIMNCSEDMFSLSNAINYSEVNRALSIGAYPLSLVYFQTPFRSFSFDIEFEKAATDLKKDPPAIPLITVECKPNPKTCNKYQIPVNSTPRMKVFRYGKVAMDYNGSLNADAIVWTMHIENLVPGFSVPSPPDDSEILLLPGEEARKNLSTLGGNVTLKIHSEKGLLIVRHCDSTIIWRQTFFGLGTTLAMLDSGSFVVNGARGSALWHSGTDGNPGADLRLQDNGYLCVYKNETCIWSNERVSSHPCITKDSHRSSDVPSKSATNNARTLLKSGETLKFGHDLLWSQNGSVGLKISTNQLGTEFLTIFRRCDGATLWSPKYLRNIHVFEKVKLKMTSDGNLIIYGSDEDQKHRRNMLWESGYGHFGDASLKLFDNGLLCVAYEDVCLWSTMRQFASVNCFGKFNTIVQGIEKPETDRFSGLKQLSDKNFTTLEEWIPESDDLWPTCQPLLPSGNLEDFTNFSPDRSFSLKTYIFRWFICIFIVSLQRSTASGHFKSNLNLCA